MFLLFPFSDAVLSFLPFLGVFFLVCIYSCVRIDMQRTYKKANTHKEATNSQSSAKDIQALQPQPQKSGHAAVCSCRWWGAITATVDKNHPAVSAANRLNARKQNKGKGGESAAANARGSPLAQPRRLPTKKLVRFAIMMSALLLRWRPKTTTPLPKVSRLISLMPLPPAS